MRVRNYVIDFLVGYKGILELTLRDYPSKLFTSLFSSRPVKFRRFEEKEEKKLVWIGSHYTKSASASLLLPFHGYAAAATAGDLCNIDIYRSGSYLKTL